MLVRTRMTLSRTTFARMAVAVRVAAFSMSLAEHRRKFGSEPSRRFLSTWRRESVLGSGVAGRDDPNERDISTRLQAIEGAPDQIDVKRGEAGDSRDVRHPTEPLSFEPIEEFEQFVLTGDRVSGVSTTHSSFSTS